MGQFLLNFKPLEEELKKCDIVENWQKENENTNIIKNKINNIQNKINVNKFSLVNDLIDDQNLEQKAHSTKKFFTDFNYGYKCSCSKTQCNRKYCECYNMGRYCLDCNCKNCQNVPPKNVYTNKHPTGKSSENKKNKEVCTCTKSGCNKKYCECYKNGNKCSSLCRCIGCENLEEDLKNKKVIYQCCLANSVSISKNNIYIDEIKDGKITKNSNDEFNFKTLNKKRNRNKSEKLNEIKSEKNKKEKNNNQIKPNRFLKYGPF